MPPRSTALQGPPRGQDLPEGAYPSPGLCQRDWSACSSTMTSTVSAVAIHLCCKRFCSVNPGLSPTSLQAWGLGTRLRYPQGSPPSVTESRRGAREPTIADLALAQHGTPSTIGGFDRHSVCVGGELGFEVVAGDGWSRERLFVG